MKPPSFLIALLVVLPLTGLLLHAGEVTSKEGIEKGLVLDLDLKGLKSALTGEKLPFLLTLRNTSTEDSFRLIRPGDGSNEGWREPFLYFTATIDTGDGLPTPVTPWRYARCGNFDRDWENGGMTLKPGEFLHLENAMHPLDMQFQFLDAGRVKLVAHYSYRALSDTGKPGSAKTSGFMANVPPFEIVSAPVEFEVVKPLGLLLTVKKAATVGNNTLSEIFDVKLVNRLDEELIIDRASLENPNYLVFEFQKSVEDHRSPFAVENITYAGNAKLVPGATMELIDLGSGPYHQDGIWNISGPQKLKARAIYSTLLHGRTCKASSDWIEVEVEAGK